MALQITRHLTTAQLTLTHTLEKLRGCTGGTSMASVTVANGDDPEEVISIKYN